MYGYRHYRFSMQLGRDELLAVYGGAIRRIRVRTDEGLVLDIDAEHLKRFTTNDGISGYFELTVTPENKFVSLEKLD